MWCHHVAAPTNPDCQRGGRAAAAAGAEAVRGMYDQRWIDHRAAHAIHRAGAQAHPWRRCWAILPTCATRGESTDGGAAHAASMLRVGEPEGRARTCTAAFDLASSGRRCTTPTEFRGDCGCAGRSYGILGKPRLRHCGLAQWLGQEAVRRRSGGSQEAVRRQSVGSHWLISIRCGPLQHRYRFREGGGGSTACYGLVRYVL